MTQSVPALSASSHDSPPTRVLLRWSGMTHRGRIRPNNEDAFLALAIDPREVRYLGKVGEAPLDGCDYIFAVSDGMGGANAGEFASRIAVERVTRLLPRSFRLRAMGLATPFADILTELVNNIHNDLLKLGQSYEECAGMGATFTLCWVTPGWCYFVHLGDSRAYLLPRTGSLTQLTHDHSHVGWLRRRGRLNEREARTHPGRTSLQQALGAGHQALDPHLGAVAFQPGDRLLLCTDGLIDGLWDRQLDEIIRTHPPGAGHLAAPAGAASDSAGAHSVARHLVEEAVRTSGRDNTTAVVVEFLPDATPSPVA